MELELKKSGFDAYDVGAELVLTQEETAETIVPDYCPDIARIIDTEGKIFLHSRELHDGKATVSGTVRVTVLYTPEGEGGIRTLEFAIPFSAESDSKAMPECVFLCAATETEFLETRILNPRKVFTHCKLVTRLTGYRRAPLAFCSDVTADAGLCLEKKSEQQPTTILTQIAEKDFTFSDEINLSSGKEGAAEILTSSVTGTVTETKIVGSKLILKGLFQIQLLYRTADGHCCAASGELPFSQIMEVEGADENASVSVQLQFTGTDIQVGNSGQDGRQIMVTLYLHAVAILRREETLTLLCDLYSTTYDLSYEVEPVLLTDFSEPLTQRQPVKEVLETGVVAESLLCVNVTCGSVSVNREGDSTALRTGATVRALYLDEGGVPLVAERCIDVSCQMDLPADCRVSARACCPEEVQSSIGAHGIEVRFPVEFQAQSSTRKKRVCIASVKVSADTPKDLSGAPSLVLRALGKEETLWALAKQYNTTMSAILTANGLESEGEIPPEKLLLIPRRRVAT
ncbi:MAG: DUF3794 domain-containing protein [Oscillibacter sp.]|jgi:hypothetical protein|nr:DUF3794 domain-containing protein [Oscillibacter sp.]